MPIERVKEEFAFFFLSFFCPDKTVIMKWTLAAFDHKSAS